VKLRKEETCRITTSMLGDAVLEFVPPNKPNMAVAPPAPRKEQVR